MTTRSGVTVAFALAGALLLAMPASAASLAKRCKKQCTHRITDCISNGTRRAKCRKQALKDCRRNGLAVCPITPPTTTSTVAHTGTTAPGGNPTTTTLPNQTFNGCDETTAVDMTTAPQVTITFKNFSYSPACVRVALGAEITFSASTADGFDMHPLIGGLIDNNGAEVPDSNSKFFPVTNIGTTK